MLTRSCSLALMCAFVVSFSVHAQTGSETPWIDQVREQIATEGHASVLVHFGGESLKQEMALQGITIEHEYRNFPVTLATMDLAQFEWLQGNKDLVSLQLDSTLQLDKTIDAEGNAALRSIEKPAGNGTTEDRERPQISDSTGAINAPAVWDLGHTGEGQAVVILGNGFYDDHDFLSDKIVHQACFSREVEDSDESLCLDGTESQTGGRAASYCPVHIHEACGLGTYVAGIAAGREETAPVRGRKGVAPDAEIIAIQVFTLIRRENYCRDGCDRVYLSSILDALEYVVDIAEEYNIAAVDLSTHGYRSVDGNFTHINACDDHILKPAIDTLRSRGIATVISAGNGNYGFISEPACISSAIAVSTNLLGGYSFAANQSPLVDIMAPGWGIESAWLNNSFVNLNGPRAAAPHVTGAFALLKSAMPSATVDQVEYALKAGGPLNSGPAWSFATPRIDVVAALNLLGEDPPLEGLAVPGVLTSNSATARSYIRLHNTSGSRGRVDITLVDDDSGKTVATHARRLRHLSTLQVGISDIEADASIDLSEVGLTYTAYVESDFAGRLQHVLWNPGEGVLTNVSPCVDGLADPGRFLAYVHTSLIQSYPSSFFVHNNRSIATRAEFTAYSNITGRELGRVETSEIAPYSSIVFAASDAYDAIDFQPRDGEFHINFVLSEDFRGFAQHIVDNRDAGVVTNMSATCELPDNTVKILSQ